MLPMLVCATKCGMVVLVYEQVPNNVGACAFVNFQLGQIAKIRAVRQKGNRAVRGPPVRESMGTLGCP